MDSVKTQSLASAAARSARRFQALVLMLILPLCFGTVALAQVNTGQISGVVTDPSGAVVPGATVTVQNVGTNAVRSAKTSSVGSYLVPGLDPAIYQVTVRSPSFQAYTARVEVTVGGHVTVDAKLSLTTNTTAVEVLAAGGVAVNTQTQELSQVVDTQQMSQLPSLTRNAYDFVMLSGNVSNGDNTTPNSNSGQNVSAQGVGYSINGQREAGTEILLDGVENITVFSDLVGEQIPIDAVQEYSILTNNFAAQYGRASGGVVNVTTKAGTNSLHGGAWEFNRLSAYTANTYNNVVNDLPKGIYTRNQFGFDLGGPIKKDKLFFFGSSEWTRVRSASVQSELIPTPQFLALAATNVQSFFAAYGSTPYPITSTVNQSALGVALTSASGAAVPAATPILGQVNFNANYDAGGDIPQNTYRLLGRVDYDLSSKTQMFFRYGKESEDEFSGTQFYSAYPQYDVGEQVSNAMYLYSLSHTFGPSVFSNTKLSYTRFANPESYNTAQQNVPLLMLGGANTPAPLQLPGLENYNEPGAGGEPYGGPQNTIQVQEDVTWTKGRHNAQFGFQGTYLQMNIAYGAYAQAVEYLGTGNQTGLQAMLNGTLQYFESAVNPQGKLPCVEDAYGNLTATSACEVTPPLTPPGFARSYRYKDWAGYAQDSFKLTPQLTLNYGVRYEHYGVQHNDNQNLDSNLYYGAGTNIFQQIETGQVYTVPNSPIHEMWKPRWGTVAPRVGFAYDLTGDGKTSLRGGFGISYERNFGNVTFNAIQNVPNYAVLESFNSKVTTSDIGPLGSAGPAQALPPAELRNINENINVAATQFWSLALERQLSRSSMLEISYSGAHGVHLYDIIVGNGIGGAQAYLGAPVYKTSTTNPSCVWANGAGTGYSSFTSNACLTRPNPEYAGVNVRGSGGSSAYDAVNIKYQAQNLYNSGLTLIANYTFSHSLDDLSSTFSEDSQGGSGYIGNLGYLDPTDPMLDWGSSDFNVPNRIVISPIWSTPWFKGQNGLAGEIGSGWSVSGIFSARSGTPFSAYDYTYNLNGYAGIPRITPLTPMTRQKAGKPVYTGTPNQFQILTIPAANDTEPFNPTLGVDDFGPFPANMMRRNSMSGPGAWSTDAAASKSFKFGERFGLEFRAEAFDLFNHHNLYTEEYALDIDNLNQNAAGFAIPPTSTAPLPVIAQKGGLNTYALGGNHDERRFGQFSLKATF